MTYQISIVRRAQPPTNKKKEWILTGNFWNSQEKKEAEKSIT